MEDLIIEKRGGIASCVLNRPQALNALTHEQVLRLTQLLRTWEQDPAVAAVLIAGQGHKAFCAGGDIRALYHQILAGQMQAVADFFREEYRLNRLIHAFAKPYISLLDGIVMGGGAGLSINGRYRIATERTLFAMPETAIGFYPDVGGTYFLSRLPGAVGIYLGLTGARLQAADTYHIGLATHFVPGSDIAALDTALSQQETGAGIAAALADFHRDPGPAPLQARRSLIDAIFGRPTLPAVLAALRAHEDPWVRQTLSVIESHSPSALAVTFDALTRARSLSFDDCLKLEYRLSLQLALSHDFIEGVRAAIIDKSHAPRWSPPSVEAVPARIYTLATIVPEGGDLSF